MSSRDNSERSGKAELLHHSDKSKKKRVVERRGLDLIFKHSDFIDTDYETDPAEERFHEAMFLNSQLKQKVDLLSDHHVILASQLEKEKADKVNYKARLDIYENPYYRHSYIDQLLNESANCTGPDQQKMRTMEDVIKILANLCELKENELTNAVHTLDMMDTEIVSLKSHMVVAVQQDEVIDDLKRNVKDLRESACERNALKEKVHRLESKIQSLTLMLQEQAIDSAQREHKLRDQVNKLHRDIGTAVKKSIDVDKKQEETDDKNSKPATKKAALLPTPMTPPISVLPEKNNPSKSPTTHTTNPSVEKFFTSFTKGCNRLSDSGEETSKATESSSEDKCQIKGVVESVDSSRCVVSVGDLEVPETVETVSSDCTSTVYSWHGEYPDPSLKYRRPKKTVSWYDKNGSCNRPGSPPVSTVHSLYSHTTDPQVSSVKSALIHPKARTYSRDEERHQNYEGYFKTTYSPTTAAGRRKQSDYIMEKGTNGGGGSRGKSSNGKRKSRKSSSVKRHA